MTRSANCSECGLTWQCAPRGRIPTMCKDCRALPDVIRARVLAQRAEKKRKADERIDSLERKLKARQGG